MALQPFKEVEMDRASISVQAMMDQFGVSESKAQDYIDQIMKEKYYLNDTYQVHVSNIHYAKDWPPTIHLSIKRIDKEPIHDWRDLQEIKNIFVGPENEGIEIYPAESKKVDMANQYHCWVFADPEIRIPIGWQERMVSDEVVAEKFNAKQRSF